MEHLSLEALARLVDESHSQEEGAHLAVCGRCRGELDAVVEQTRSLGGLPLRTAPDGEWEGIEARLRVEGLVGDAAPVASSRRSLGWLRMAAMVVPFVVGVATGWSLRGPAAESGALELGVAPPAAPALTPITVPSSGSLEEAAELVRMTEELYVEALLRYGVELDSLGFRSVGDPIGRYFALGSVLAVAREAVRDAPADPFLNGLMINTIAEQEATLHRISLGGASIP